MSHSSVLVSRAGAGLVESLRESSLVEISDAAANRVGRWMTLRGGGVGSGVPWACCAGTRAGRPRVETPATHHHMRRHESG
ncbi:MAG TPA: hypothetical protein VK969_11315 [Acidimicrobiia bacterium]|nr:hypothetical protein [Acidimicrobiia bacterium]